MSKSPSIFIPALGGAALVLGIGYGVASRDWGKAQIETLQTRLEAAQEQVRSASDTAAAAAERARELETQLAEVTAEAQKARLAAEAAMSKRASSSGAATLVSAAAPAPDGPFGLGREALPEEVAAWDLDVSPDGQGLPVGSGDVLTGEELFSDRCAACHGEFAEGADNWPALAGGQGTLADKDPVKTVGSYWPYLSTVWDYAHRSMPFGDAQSLTDDEVYAIVAYILYSNDIVDDEEFVLSNENFLDIRMPNADGFVIDDREQAEYAMWRTEPCMENCKDSVEITMRARVLDVTPDTGDDSGEAMDHAAAVTEEASPVSEAAPAATEAAATETETETAAVDPALVEAGEKVFRKCKSCHQIGAGAKNRSGPHLNGVVGRTAGSVDGFRYSGAMADAGAGGLVWTDETLAEFLAAPKSYMPGTKMSFSGLKSDEDIAAMLAWLKAASE